MSLLEYLRLRQILLWCSSQVSREAEALMEVVLPTAELFSKHFDSLKASNKSYAVLADPKFLYSNLNGIVARIVQFGVDWSQVVRLHSIHPVLLYTVIKPLGVIPTDLFEAALRYQGCHLRDISTLKWVVNGKEYKGYTTLDNGAVLCATDGSGLPPVRIDMPINKPCGIYRFEVAILEVARGMIIGVGSVPAPGQGGRSFTAENYLALVQRNQCSYEVDPFGKNSRIFVQVDMAQRNCRILSGVSTLGTFQINSREVVLFVRFDPPGKVRIALQTPVHLM